MIIANLSRKESNQDGMFGVLTFGDEELITLERPLSSATAKPIRAGRYELVPHSGNKYKNVLALVSIPLGVSHWPTKSVPRSAILIHAANFSSQLKGCIALGEKKITLWDQKLQRDCQAISNSRRSCERFFAYYHKQRQKYDNLYIQINDFAQSA